MRYHTSHAERMLATILSHKCRVSATERLTLNRVILDASSTDDAGVLYQIAQRETGHEVETDVGITLVDAGVRPDVVGPGMEPPVICGDRRLFLRGGR